MRAVFCILSYFVLPIVAAAAEPAAPQAATQPSTHAAPGTAANPAVDPAARKVLDAAIDAARDVKSIRYEATAEFTGIYTAQFGKVSGSVLMEKVSGAQVPKVHIDARLQTPAMPESERTNLAYDGKRVTAAEYGPTLWSDLELNASANVLNPLFPLLIFELTQAEPYEREQKATLKLQEPREIAGVKCDVLVADLKEGTSEWWLAQSDHLPRKVVRNFRTPGGEGGGSFTFAKLTLNPAASEDDYRVSKPDGFLDATQLTNRGGRTFRPEGTLAPDFTLKTPEGKDVRLKDQRGKVVLLDFWATWCGPCKMAMPDVQKLWDKYKDKPFVVYGVDTWERSDAAAFMKAQKYTYPLLLNGDNVAKRYLVAGIPTFYLIGPEGKILLAYAGVGGPMEQQLERVIEEVLRKMGALPPESQPTSGPGAASAPTGDAPIPPVKKP